MSLEAEIQDDVANILDECGITITVYFSATRTLDDEGYDTIAKGTGTTATARIETFGGEVLTPETFGISKQQRFRCYFKYDVGTVDEDTIIEWNSQYYKVISIDRHPLGSESITYYEVEIERIMDPGKVS